MERYIQNKKFILIADNTRKQSKTFQKRRDYFMRIKVHEKKSKEDFIEFLNVYNNHVESYQVALEGDNETNYHIQAVIKFQKNFRRMMDECFRSSFKEWYEKTIKSSDHKRINSYYSLGRIRENSLRALAYNFKEDRDAFCNNINAEDVRIARMLSHGKDLRQMSKQMEDLKEKYFRNQLTTQGLVREMILLKCKFNQNIYLNRIEAEARYIMIKKNNLYANDMASNVMNRILGD